MLLFVCSVLSCYSEINLTFDGCWVRGRWSKHDLLNENVVWIVPSGLASPHCREAGTGHMKLPANVTRVRLVETEGAGPLPATVTMVTAVNTAESFPHHHSPRMGTGLSGTPAIDPRLQDNTHCSQHCAYKSLSNITGPEWLDRDQWNCAVCSCAPTRGSCRLI